MNPAKCKLAICPHCGHKKEILQLISGNTFDAVQWSDAKLVAPMLPKASPVQKCPQCGKFYFLNEVESEEGTNYSLEEGWLDFDDAVKAYEELNDNSDPEKSELLLLIVVWAYNDIIRDGREPLCEQAHVFKNIVGNALKQNVFSCNLILRAELFREISSFDECISVLSTYKPDEEFLQQISNQILEKAKEKNNCVFAFKEEES